METCEYQTIETGDDRHSTRKTLHRQLMVSSCVWMSYIMSGLCFGGPTVMIPQIRKAANSTEAVSEEMASWISSVHGYAAVPWVIILPILCNKFGRKYTYLFINASAGCSFVFLYCSTSTLQILFSEIIQGILVASQVSISVIIVAEYTSPVYRGLFMTIKSATFLWGLWLANVVGTFFNWRFIPCLGIILSIYNVFVICFWPESPIWLASVSKFGDCAKCHRLLRGVDESSEKELNDLIQSRKEETSKNNTDLNIFQHIFVEMKRKGFYKSFFISSIVLSIYHFSGKFVCAIYAIEMLKKVTKSESTAYTGMLILDGITVLGAYIGSGLSKFFTRRVLLLTTSLIGIIFILVLSLYYYLVSCLIIVENNYVSLVLLTGFSLCISGGPIILSTSIYGELMPLRSRSLFMVCSALYYNLVSGTFLKLAPLMFRVLRLHGTFLFYGASSSILLLLIYKFLPETKDKTLVEIQNYFSKDKKEIEIMNDSVREKLNES